ncbi:MAG: glycosyltransferase family 1 protein [Nitrospirae bacterium]|nr:MAG: glycosyltransferase family 1 protein [Nitrospirota bacterium]
MQMRIPSVGLMRQMQEEQAASETLGIPWTSRIFVPEGRHNRICVEANMSPQYGLAFKRAYYNWLLKESNNYDIMLLRYSTNDFFQLKFLSCCSIPVLFVHHTIEVPEIFASRGFFSKIKAMVEWGLGPVSIRKASGIVAVTGEIAEYESYRSGRDSAAAFIYPNGIGYNNNSSCTDNRTGDFPEILFVGSNFPDWHGLDLLMDSVSGCSSRFLINLVGDLTDEQRQRAVSDGRYVIHGVMKPVDIEHLSGRCWVGLSSFALQRKGMRDACPLKVREYLRSGLPVYSGHKDVFDEDMTFYRVGRCDIDDILAFACEMRSVDKEVVARTAQLYIDKKIILSRLYEQLCRDFV